MSAKNYEMVYILHPATPEEELTNLSEKIKQWITTSGGEVTAFEPWGKRQLAYTIQKVNEGYYNLLRMSAQPAALTELERNLKLMEPLLRHLIVKV
jgi:small subunit ribosomal protein S6